MCLKLTLELVMHMSLIMWPSLSQILHLLSSLQTTPLLSAPPPHAGEPQEVNFKKIRKTKHFPEKMDFPKSHQKPQGVGFHAENQIICRDMTDTFLGAFGVAAELGILNYTAAHLGWQLLLEGSCLTNRRNISVVGFMRLEIM